jgi:Holliday junction resolvase RusA-like endonuclease
MQALADTLEAAGVVPDDKYIAAWDGSRLLKDAADPRVEVTLTPMEP